MKIAIISNVNTDYIHRILSRKFDMIPVDGYGEVWEQLLNPASSFNLAEPDIVCILMDIEELTRGAERIEDARKTIDEWFGLLDTALTPQKEYFISDVMSRHESIEDNDEFLENSIEGYWRECLAQRILTKGNLHVLKLATAVNRMGREAFFSDKLWYMGGIPFSNRGSCAVAEIIEDMIGMLYAPAKKVLVLDMDNTLWGGILGERGAEGIDLSDYGVGAIYKEVQLIIKAMIGRGVLLALCSKNNGEDVQEVWKKNPHMVLEEKDFVSVKVNWRDKVDNIREIAKELNLGTDSFVFLDDMEPERENVRARLPEVTVPEFPKEIERYPEFIRDVYTKFFRKLRTTSEDAVKTQQYIENSLRARSGEGVSYEEFLASLELKAERVNLDELTLQRIVQMLGKTNQFNLTTKRYSRRDIEAMLQSHYRAYAYRVWDRFGDYGLVALLIVDIDIPKIDTFLMSCRVMGKQLEDFFINDVEEELMKEGYSELTAEYIPTKKNMPVAELYSRLGYETVEKTDERTLYKLALDKRPRRVFFVNHSE